MDSIYQLIGVGTVFGLTYVFFTLLGQRRETLLLTRDESKDWSRLVAGRFGGALTVANIFATVTSLATVYLFFIGSSKLFGLWTLSCSVSIVIGGVTTNYFTKKIRKLARTKSILAHPTQSGAVVASLFWSQDLEARRVASVVKFLSLFAIASIVWLEFALFGDITARILGSSFTKAAVFVGVATIAVVWFTLRFGLRGFVMADLLHSAIVVAGIVVFLVGTIYLFRTEASVSLVKAFEPIVPPSVLVLFVFHVVVANAFLTLVSESHWLRLWVFSDNEVKQQIPAQVGTALVWTLLIFIGLLASGLTGTVDTENVAKLLGRLKEYSALFVMAFWLGGTAALFSTADAQIYGFRLVMAFDIRTGAIPDQAVSSRSPILVAIAAGLAAALLYVVVRAGDIPFDKIVFILLPITLNLLPAFVQLAFGYTVRLWPILISLIIYVILAGVGFTMPENQLAATLAAALAPIVVSAIALLLSWRGKNHV